MKLTLYCSLCGTRHAIHVPIGDWKLIHGSIENETALCPEHAIVEQFFSAQCPGCVCGWPDCGLGDTFRHCDNPSRLTFSDADRERLREGFCPRRVNGTLGVDRRAGRIEDINLSDPAPKEAGTALATAIDAYIAKWSKPKPSIP